MSSFGHVNSIAREVGGKTYTFRSKLEYKWAVWCQLRKEQGLILDWWYEPKLLQVVTRYFSNIKQYLPDFAIQMPDGSYEFEECKGWFPPKDATKIRLAAEQSGRPITLIFERLNNCKSLRAQYNRAQRLEPHIKRVIYDAGKTIFKPISGLFDL